MAFLRAKMRAKPSNAVKVAQESKAEWWNEEEGWLDLVELVEIEYAACERASAGILERAKKWRRIWSFCEAHIRNNRRQLEKVLHAHRQRMRALAKVRGMAYEGLRARQRGELFLSGNYAAVLAREAVTREQKRRAIHRVKLRREQKLQAGEASKGIDGFDPHKVYVGVDGLADKNVQVRGEPCVSDAERAGSGEDPQVEAGNEVPGET